MNAPKKPAERTERRTGEPATLSGRPTGNALRMQVESAAAIAVAAIAAAVFIAHVRAYFFLLDDFVILGEVSTRSASTLLTHTLFDFYRPGEHLWVKSWFTFFGWRVPGGYAAASLALHVACAVLVARLARACDLAPRASVVAALLFLLSPWATEPIFWMSGGFDLICTLGLLAAVLLGLSVSSASSAASASSASSASSAASASSASSASSAASTASAASASSASSASSAASAASAASASSAYSVASASSAYSVASAAFLAGTAAAAAAMLAKETGVVAPAVFAAAVVCLRGPRALASREAAAYLVALGIVAAIYLALRQTLLPGFNSSYGTLSTLLAKGSLASNAFAYARAYVMLPQADAWRALSIPFGAAVVALVALACAHNWRLGVLGLAAMAISIAPVVWVALGGWSSAGNRFLYFGGAWLAVLLAAGTERLRGALRAAALVAVFGIALVSLVHQARIWIEAAALSRSAIDQVRPFEGTSQPLFITNLPFAFRDGPYVLNTLAFKYYFRGAMPPVRAHTLALKDEPGRLELAFWADDETAAPGERPVTLQYAAWMLDARPEGRLEAPADGATVRQPFTISGWAIDANAREGTGIDAVRVYAYPVPGAESDAVFLGAARYGLARDDVERRFGAPFAPSGFSLEASGLRPGRYRLVVNPRLTLTRRTERTLTSGIVVK